MRGLQICLLFSLFGIAACRPDSVSAPNSEAEKFEQLLDQARGKICNYDIRCRYFQPDSLFGVNRYACRTQAAYCLAALGGNSEKVMPVLEQALKEMPKTYDTGDGVIPIHQCLENAMSYLRMGTRSVSPISGCTV